MSADFWAGYLSGAAGILIGNPLDLMKVRLQAGASPGTPSSPAFTTAGSLIRGATAPIIGYGALNALLFVTYNRTSSLLTQNLGGGTKASLTTTWIAGAIGGLATWAVSTPTELIKCRAQTASPLSSSSPQNSWGITKQILRTEGVRGLYVGGMVTAWRDSIGYGFYFWTYELSSRVLEEKFKGREIGIGLETARVLLCGGVAGVVTWASVFPLDVVKTRVQTQVLGEGAALLGNASVVGRRLGAVEIARVAYRNQGLGVFFRGLGVCSVRAFVVNAVQWAVYEWIMKELNPKTHRAMDK